MVGDYLRALAHHRPAGRYEAPPVRAARCSLDRLAAWLGRVPVASLNVTAVPVRGGGRDGVTVEVTLSARLLAGGTRVGLGQRVLSVAAVSGRAVVRADVTATASVGAAQDGLAALGGLRYRVGRSAVVAYQSGADAPAAVASRVADAVWPALERRFGRSPRPVIVIAPSWGAASRVAGVPVSRWEAGVELNGLVLLIEPAWLCCGGSVFEQGLVVHELTHVATAGQVGGTPISLVEGIARLEEERYDAAHGAAYPEQTLAAAYTSGWSSENAWSQLGSVWYEVGGQELERRYLDGAAVLDAVQRDGGPAAVTRLERALRAQGLRASTGLLSAAQLSAAFSAATGRTFAAVVAQAHRLIAGGAGPGHFP